MMMKMSSIVRMKLTKKVKIPVWRTAKRMIRINETLYIVSDCNSLNEMFNAQHYTKTPEETAALAVNSGLDLNCGSFLSDHVQAAVDKGLLKEAEIDRAVSYNFYCHQVLGCNWPQR